jgi:hypothetical protein
MPRRRFRASFPRILIKSQPFFYIFERSNVGSGIDVYSAFVRRHPQQISVIHDVAINDPRRRPRPG